MAPTGPCRAGRQRHPPKAWELADEGEVIMRIGVFCSGGDAPGMNSCLRAVVRSGISAEQEVVGIRRGYQGLLEEDFPHWD